MSRASLWESKNRITSLLHFESSFFLQIKCLSTQPLCAHINEQWTQTTAYQNFLKLCHHGQLDSALQMLSQKSVPDNLYIAFLKACIREKNVHQVQQALSNITSLRPELNGLLGDNFVTAFVKCGSMSCALRAFQCLNPRTVFAWTAMISGYASCGNGSEALRMYQLMKQDGFEPDQYTYVSLFKACGSIPDLEEGRKLHFEVKKKCLMFNTFVVNSVLSMYCKAKSLAEAEAVFSSMPNETRNVVSWNALLSGYVEQGDFGKALMLYRQMLEFGTKPNELTFVMAIQACSLKQGTKFPEHDHEFGLVIGQALHADACRKCFVLHPLVASTLMCMYGKYMEIEKAEYVFSSLSERNLVTWTTMLKGYVEKGQSKSALQLYKPILEKRICLDQKAFVLLFQACCILAKEEEPVISGSQSLKLRSLEIGCELHKDARKMGFDKDVFVGGTIVNMYGKCGSVADAENAFLALPQHDVVLWNVMLSVYVEQEKSEQALYLYEKMLEKGVILDERTIVSILQACTVHVENSDDIMSVMSVMSVKEFCNGLHIHAHKCGFSSNVFLGNTLIHLYGKLGWILEAEHVFLSSSRSSIATWNVMLGVYLELEQYDKSLKLYRQLQELVIPDERTFVLVLQACLGLLQNEFTFKDSKLSSGQMMLLDIVTALHADALKKGFMSNVFVGNSFITLYAKCRTVDKAEAVFRGLEGRSVVSWNAMLSVYTENKWPYSAFQLYLHMHEEGRNPDPQTIVVILQACSLLIENAERQNGLSSQNIALGICKALHKDAQRHCLANNVYVANSLLSIYGKCGKLDDAADTFYTLCQCNVVSWNALLTSYVDHGKGDEALSTYEKMISSGVMPNEVTVICILQACSEACNRKLCKEIHFNVASNGLDSNLAIATTLIHAYGGCACIADSEVTFNFINLPVVESWNAFISSFSSEENHDICNLSFQEMYSRGIEPSKATFSALLLTFSHRGFIDSGLKCFVSMNEEFGLVPELKHYVIITDLLGRAGNFGRVENIISNMSVQPDLAFWLCLLGSCRIHGNLELGERVYSQALLLQPDEAALYVSLSNIYADVRHMPMD